MQTDSLQKQAAEPVDDVTKAAIEQAQAEHSRGEGVTQEEARVIVRKRYKEWQKTQQEVFAA